MFYHDMIYVMKNTISNLSHWQNYVACIQQWCARLNKVFLHMDNSVALQTTLLVESLATYLTGVRFLPCVYSHVTVKPRCRSKTFAANIALEFRNGRVRQTVWNVKSIALHVNWQQNINILVLKLLYSFKYRTNSLNALQMWNSTHKQ